jgi:hypothetical protein
MNDGQVGGITPTLVHFSLGNIVIGPILFEDDVPEMANPP